MKEATMTVTKLLLVEEVGRDAQPGPGAPYVAVDLVGAGEGELVLVAHGTPAVRPGSQVVEREFGLLALHADDPEVVAEAGRVILDRLKLVTADRLRPTIVSEEVITNITPFQAQLINRMRRGSLLVPGQTLLVVHVTPAAYILLAANEAERAAQIDIIDIRPVGRFGRLYISGDESNVREAQEGVRRGLAGVPGRESR